MIDCQKGESAMGEMTPNILDPVEIVRLKAVLSEIVLSLPKKRSCAMQVSIAAQLLELAAGEGCNKA
jgi:hypothetical protein